MEKEVTKQFCPICKTEVKTFPRYPKYLCPKCSKKVVSSDGRPLEFFNKSLSGGFVAYFADTKVKYDSHICFVEGVKCFADEARFGGIVIQTFD